MSDRLSARKGKPKNYFKREKFMLKMCGISLTGNDSFTYKIYSKFIMYCLIFPYVIVASTELFKYNNFSNFLETIVYVIGFCMDILITATTFFNRLKLGKLLARMEQEPFLANTERGGNKEDKLLNGWISTKEKQKLLLSIVTVSVYLYRVMDTLSKRLRSSDYHDWEFGFGSITIFDVTCSPNYEILWMYQNIVLAYVAVNTCCSVLVLVSILEHTAVQFQMLQNNLRRLVSNIHHNMLKDTPKSARIYEIVASRIPWKYLKRSLNDVVLYHLGIIEAAADLTKIFSNTILFMYLFTIGMVCCEVYRTSMVSRIIKFVHMVFLMSSYSVHEVLDYMLFGNMQYYLFNDYQIRLENIGHIYAGLCVVKLPINDPGLPMLLVETYGASMFSFIICNYGQKMTEESLKVAEAAYEANYVGVDLRFQKGLMMIVQRSQRPLIIKAGKFIETSMVTYVWIVRTAYSTYMVLRKTQHV